MEVERDHLVDAARVQQGDRPLEAEAAAGGGVVLPRVAEIREHGGDASRTGATQRVGQQRHRECAPIGWCERPDDRALAVARRRVHACVQLAVREPPQSPPTPLDRARAFQQGREPRQRESQRARHRVRATLAGNWAAISATARRAPSVGIAGQSGWVPSSRSAPAASAAGVLSDWRIRPRAASREATAASRSQWQSSEKSTKGCRWAVSLERRRADGKHRVEVVGRVKAEGIVVGDGAARPRTRTSRRQPSSRTNARP